jgi:hypothetical protein
MRCPESNSAVPTAGAEAIFCHKVPVHTKHLPTVFLPVHDREIIGGCVVELDAAITRRSQDLVLVDFGPGKVIEGVLCGEPNVYTRQKLVYLTTKSGGSRVGRFIWPTAERWKGSHIPFHRYNPIGSELENIQPAVTDQAKIGCTCDGQTVIEEGRILYRTAIEALRAVVEHGGRLIGSPITGGYEE